MSAKRIDGTMVAACVLAVVVIGLAGLASRYVSGQASRYFSQRVDEAIGSAGRSSSWETIRDGGVLGRAELKNGGAAYIAIARRAGGEYRTVLEVDGDGSVLKSHPLGATNGFVFAKRLGSLFVPSAKGGLDVSPLDASLHPLVVGITETIAGLERAHKEASRGTR